MQLTLDSRLMCDLELLLNGSFAPLTGFMGQADYQSVISNMKLADGSLWPMPIVLPITAAEKDELSVGEIVTLADETNLHLASLTVTDIYQPDLDLECDTIYGDSNHPYTKIVRARQAEGKTFYLGGTVTQLQEIPHCDFKDHRLTPVQVQKLIADKSWETVVAFQTRNPMHRSHYELTQYALEKAGQGSKLLLQPIVGVTQECDIDYFTRVKCYVKLLNYYEKDSVILSLLPLSMRMAGPREALWHALIRKNYGATHFVVGRDHAGPSCKSTKGEPFYDPYGAHELLESVKGELAITVIKSKWIVYVSSLEAYMSMDEVPAEHKEHIEMISGTEQRRLLREGLEIPEWFSFPEIIRELRKTVPDKHHTGLCLYLVGLSGSGKTTVAKHLDRELREHLAGGRQITILDGDIIRRNLSKGLGFSKEDRSTNVRRIGFVASEIVKHRGVVICANIAPYREDRDFNRNLISQNGSYVEVYVNTPLNVCENRDVKGLYAKARSGQIKLTGVNDPFEEPEQNEITLTEENINRQVHKVITYLHQNQLI